LATDACKKVKQKLAKMHTGIANCKYVTASQKFMVG